MSLEYAILSLWILASMLGCWGFSLVVRLLTEWRARQRKKLAAHYTRRSVVVGIGTALLCVMASVIAGAFAYYMDSFPTARGTDIGSLGALGAGMLLFGCMLITWGAVGDRARGRLRCPRCWYDLRDSLGMPCPECGLEILNEKQMHRTRRPRWAFVVALVFLLVGSSGIGVDMRFRRMGVVGFVPNSVLLSKWRTLPDAWVYDTGLVNSNRCLVYRIRSGSIGEAARQELANELFDAMIATPENRWDQKHMAMLEALAIVELFGIPGNPEAADGAVWSPDGDRLMELYTLAVEDANAVFFLESQDDIDSIETLILDSTIGVYADTFSITESWLLAQELGRPERYGWNQYAKRSERIEVLAESLHTIIPEVERIDDLSIYRSDDLIMMSRLNQIQTVTGVLPDRLDAYLEAYETDPGAYHRYMLSAIGSAILYSDDARRTRAFTTIHDWIEDGDLKLRLAGIEIVGNTGSELISDQGETPEQIVQLIKLLEADAVDDQRSPPPPSPNLTVSERARLAIVLADSSGRHGFPIIREEMLHPEASQHTMYSCSYRTFAFTKSNAIAWADAFEGLIEHEDPAVRKWIVECMPELVGTSVDARLDAMLEMLIEDPDLDIRDMAYDKSQTRQLNGMRGNP